MAGMAGDDECAGVFATSVCKRCVKASLKETSCCEGSQKANDGL